VIENLKRGDIFSLLFGFSKALVNYSEVNGQMLGLRMKIKQNQLEIDSESAELSDKANQLYSMKDAIKDQLNKAQKILVDKIILEKYII